MRRPGCLQSGFRLPMRPAAPRCRGITTGYDPTTVAMPADLCPFPFHPGLRLPGSSFINNRDLAATGGELKAQGATIRADDPLPETELPRAVCDNVTFEAISHRFMLDGCGCPPPSFTCGAHGRNDAARTLAEIAMPLGCGRRAEQAKCVVDRHTHPFWRRCNLGSPEKAAAAGSATALRQVANCSPPPR